MWPGTRSDGTSKPGSQADRRSDEQIALELRVALRTVRFHRTQIGQKLGISGTAAMTKYAVAHGLVREGPSI